MCGRCILRVGGGGVHERVGQFSTPGVAVSGALAGAQGDTVDALLPMLRTAGTRRPRLGALHLGLIARITRGP